MVKFELNFSKKIAFLSNLFALQNELLILVSSKSLTYPLTYELGLLVQLFIPETSSISFWLSISSALIYDKVFQTL